MPRSLDLEVDSNNLFHLTTNETNKDNAESVGKGAENPMRYLQAQLLVTQCPN